MRVSLQKFSQPLIGEITSYFREVFGDELTVDEAADYLDSLADLYLCMGKGSELLPNHDPASEAAGRGGVPAAQDLISPHSC
jgi:hypothetical protein